MSCHQLVVIAGVERTQTIPRQDFPNLLGATQWVALELPTMPAHKMWQAGLRDGSRDQVRNER